MRNRAVRRYTGEKFSNARRDHLGGFHHLDDVIVLAVRYLYFLTSPSTDCWSRR
ncbi:MAG: hypothetical protein JWO42_3088 [Chloroflexi bacterium]|jgi:hypothetical protein|nr:hypothetical protein [Chloroflexota bacterium]